MVEIELLRSLARGAGVHKPGDRIRVPIVEAEALFATGFARPLGASSGWNAAPRAGWVKAWRV